MFLCESRVTAGSAQVHYDPVLLDLCYLQELDVILCVWKVLHLSVSPPQIIDLLLQSLQSSFISTHCSLFLISDQPYQLRAASLNGADELSKDPLTVLHCSQCRVLLGHTVIQASESETERALLPSMFAHTRNLFWWQKLPVHRDNNNTQISKNKDKYTFLIYIYTLYIYIYIYIYIYR